MATDGPAAKPSCRWRPGESGNPRGKPRGAGKVARLREAIGDALPQVIERLVQSALSGDVGAARLLLERVCPALRPVEVPAVVSLPADGTLTEQARALLAAAATGALAPAQAAALVQALGTTARIAEADDLAARVRALEEALEANHARQS